MAKIPLHNLFEKYLGIGKITSKEQLLALAKKLREEGQAEKGKTPKKGASPKGGR